VLVQNFGWAASDLVANKTREAFVPLIEQLTARVVRCNTPALLRKKIEISSLLLLLL